MGLSTKYSQSNISKLSTAKAKPAERQPLVGKHESHIGATKAVSQSEQRKQRVPKYDRSMPDQGHLTMQSPPNSFAQDRRPLFDHGRTSRSKQVKTYYPSLKNGTAVGGASSSAKL